MGFVKIRALSWSHKATENLCDMMTVDKGRIFLEHGTTMCGDPKVWFSMRVYYSQELICHLKSSNKVLYSLRYMLDQTAMKWIRAILDIQRLSFGGC